MVMTLNSGLKGNGLESRPDLLCLLPLLQSTQVKIGTLPLVALFCRGASGVEVWSSTRNPRVVGSILPRRVTSGKSPRSDLSGALLIEYSDPSAKGCKEELPTLRN